MIPQRQSAAELRDLLLDRERCARAKAPLIRLTAANRAEIVNHLSRFCAEQQNEGAAVDRVAVAAMQHRFRADRATPDDEEMARTVLSMIAVAQSTARATIPDVPDLPSGS